MYIRRMKKRVTYRAPKTSEPLVLNDAIAPLEVEAQPLAMVRTQVYLTRQQYDFLQAEGTRRSEPMAAVLRSFVDEKMAIPEEAWENNPLLAPPADPSFKGPEDGAINHDHYIYGCPKKWIKQNGQWVEAPPLPDDYYDNAQSAAAYDRQLKELDESARPA
jgi:hypothetical protein